MDKQVNNNMIKVILDEVKDYNNLLYDYIKALDARASAMMSIIAVIIVLYFNIIPNIILFMSPLLLVMNLVFYFLSFLAYGISFIFIRKFVACPEPVHLVNNYYGKNIQVIQFNLIENAVYVTKELSKVIAFRAILMKAGGVLFILGLCVTLYLLITLIIGG